MQFDEVVTRVLRRHAVLVVMFVLAGLIGVWAVHHGDRRQYEATTRLVLDSPDPTSQPQAAAIADTARAIATGPSLVGRALREVGAVRDPVRFGDTSVTVASLGSSGVMRLSVTDAEPRVAVAMANALAAAVVAARARLTDGSAGETVGSLQRQVSAVGEQLAVIDEKIDALIPRAAGSPADQASLRALERSRETVSRRLDQLQGELVVIQGQRALRPQAKVIERATSADAVPGRMVPDYVLGALLGLIIGVGVAATKEMLAPTVAGQAALARALGAPVLADLPAPPEQCGRIEVAAAARHVELAALAGGVDRVEVMCLDAAVDLEGFVDLLDAEQSEAEVREADLVVPAGGRFVPGSAASRFAARAGRGPSSRGADARSIGLVVVTPRVVRLTGLQPVQNLLTITSWPLLGVVVYRPAHRRWHPARLVDRLRPHRTNTERTRQRDETRGEPDARSLGDRG